MNAAWLGNRPDNECRFDGSRTGHVESYFWRLNDPAHPRALWLKATVFAPTDAEAVAETWAVWFDGDKNRTWAHRATQAYASSSFPNGRLKRIEVAGATFDVGSDGATKGGLDRNGESATWDLRWTREAGPLGDPLSLLPSRRMIDGAFPKSKTLTPCPALRFTGSVTVAGERVAIDGWRGMQGHNWGKEHASEYAWGQCLFKGDAGAPDAMVEGFTARVRVGSRQTPRLSSVVVRRGSETYRFDRVFDFWRQKATLDAQRWTVRLSGNEGHMELEMDASGRPMVCLGYRNPDGRMSYCFNSKLAKTRLRVEPRHGAAFECVSENGGALEFLRTKPDARFPGVV